MNKNIPEFQQKQFELANVIRANRGSLAGVEQRRVKVYQELFFNNVEGFCASAFPVFKSLLSEVDWLELVRSFFMEHQCETPHFCEISYEFLEFLLQQKGDDLPYPYMLELAHYEWAELACSVAVTNEQLTTDNSVLNFNYPLSVSEAVMPVSYQYPVHTISAENASNIEPVSTSLVVYRDSDDDVQFMLVDALSIVCLQLIQQQSQITANELISSVNQMNPALSKEQLMGFMQQAFTEFLRLNILIIE